MSDDNPNYYNGIYKDRLNEKHPEKPHERKTSKNVKRIRRTAAQNTTASLLQTFMRRNRFFEIFTKVSIWLFLNSLEFFHL